MNPFFKKTDSFVLIAMFLIVGLVSWNFYFKTFHQQDTVDIHEFPKTIEGWTSEELVITEDEYRILETKNAFVRQYTSPGGEDVILFVVYSQNNRKVAHPPEICYTGGGVVISDSVHDSIPIDSENTVIDVNRLSLEAGQDKQFSFYWFKVGDSFTPNYWKQQLLIAFKTLTGQSVGSALVRVSTSIAGDETAATARVKEFTNLMLPSLKQYLP
jgi:EpsI family protein